MEVKKCEECGRELLNKEVVCKECHPPIAFSSLFTSGEDIKMQVFSWPFCSFLNGFLSPRRRSIIVVEGDHSLGLHNGRRITGAKHAG